MDSETEKRLLSVVHAVSCLDLRSVYSKATSRTTDSSCGLRRFQDGPGCLRSSRLPCLALALQR